MANKVVIKMDSFQTIAMKRNLEQNGAAQKFFTSEVARQCDPYVPMDTGALKNTKTVAAGYVHYRAPYAAKQYYYNRGGNNGPLRGKQWDKRMWADRGNQIVQAVAKYVGGKAK